MCLTIMGFVLCTTTRSQLGTSLTVSPQAKQLVTRGLYSRIRSPISVFGACVIAGLMVVSGRLMWLLVLLVIIRLQIWRVRKESQGSRQTFGGAYRKYRADTWF
jgi:protein-S-isoprenylcysteine O-methyltransferase Ste14